jgi:hypothetical protein
LQEISYASPHLDGKFLIAKENEILSFNSILFYLLALLHMTATNCYFKCRLSLPPPSFQAIIKKEKKMLITERHERERERRIAESERPA